MRSARIPPGQAAIRHFTRGLDPWVLALREPPFWLVDPMQIPVQVRLMACAKTVAVTTHFIKNIMRDHCLLIF